SDREAGAAECGGRGSGGPDSADQDGSRRGALGARLVPPEGVPWDTSGDGDGWGDVVGPPDRGRCAGQSRARQRAAPLVPAGGWQRDAAHPATLSDRGASTRQNAPALEGPLPAE